MDVVLVDCKLIDMPQTEGSKRTFSKEFAVQLAGSLKAEGMYNPIVLRPNPTKPGRYILVQGRHRLYSWWKILKNTHIQSIVLVDMDETDAAMAAVAENLWRNPLTQKQHLLAIKDWFDYFAAKNPSKIGSGGARNFKKPEPAAITEVKDDTADAGIVADAAETAAIEGVSSEPNTKAEADQEASFATMYSRATGKAATTGKNVTAIMKAFDKDQIEVLNQTDVSQVDKVAISRVRDKAKRDEVVNLLVSGMTAAEALKEVMGDAAPVLKSAKAKEEADAKAAARAESQETLTDGEWYELHCAEKGRMFKKPAKYRTAAILYRVCAEGRYAFRAKHKKDIAKAKQEAGGDPLTNLFNRVISLAHPKDWLICITCKGTGDSPTGGVCDKCYGCGFSLKTETYL